jgi:hypothetical protein
MPSARSVVIKLNEEGSFLAGPRSLKCASFIKFAFSLRLGTWPLRTVRCGFRGLPPAAGANARFLLLALRLLPFSRSSFRRRRGRPHAIKYLRSRERHENRAWKSWVQQAFASRARRARRFFQHLHRHEVRAGTMAHPCDAMLC